MIVELAAVAGAIASTGVAPVVAGQLCARARRRRHQQCLRNIDRIERELFPEWFTQPSAVEHKRQLEHVLIHGGFDPDELELGPGVRWPVEVSNHVQIISSTVSATAGVCVPIQLVAHGRPEPGDAVMPLQRDTPMGVQLELPAGDGDG